MGRYLDTTGNSTLGIGLCGRCGRKFPLGELHPDPNYPALMVCEADTDEYDPYRLAPRAPDQVVLPFVRPDESVATAPSGVLPEDGTTFIVTEDGAFLYVFP